MPSVLQQQTLRESVSFEGVGLHSGNRVGMSFLPAPPNTGIRFRRVDLDGKPEIEARIENVSDTTRSTTLSKGNIRVHTVEHLRAANCGPDTGYGNWRSCGQSVFSRKSCTSPNSASSKGAAWKRRW